MQFAGEVALITGGNSGIGRAAAIAFANAGASVVIAARTAESGNAVVKEISDAGGAALFVKTDVANSADVQAMVQAAVDTYGRLDFAVNNAGYLPDRSPIHETDEATWERSIRINLTGVWLGMKYQIAQMLQDGRGSIVNVSSVGGLRGARGAAGYSASKHGVIGLTKSAALEYVRQGIRVNAVCPGFIDTPMTEQLYDNAEGRERIVTNQPAGRGGSPEEVAAAILWLCSDAASLVNGIAMPVDGGIMA